MYISIELKSVVILIVFNSIILNAYIKINDINRKIDALRATFKWAIECNSIKPEKSIDGISGLQHKVRSVSVFNLLVCG